MEAGWKRWEKSHNTSEVIRIYRLQISPSKAPTKCTSFGLLSGQRIVNIVHNHLYININFWNIPSLQSAAHLECKSGKQYKFFAWFPIYGKFVRQFTKKMNGTPVPFFSSKQRVKQTINGSYTCEDLWLERNIGTHILVWIIIKTGILIQKCYFSSNCRM